MPQIITQYLPALVDTYGGTPATATPVSGTYNESGYATVKTLGVIRYIHPVCPRVSYACCASRLGMGGGVGLHLAIVSLWVGFMTLYA